MKNLFIIGNGFDLAHDLKTSYLDFKKYVEENDPQFFKDFYSLHMYSFEREYENPLMTESINDEYEGLWKNIESNMKDVNEDLIFDANLELGLEYNDPYSEDCFDTAYDYLLPYIKGIPEKLLENLQRWVETIELEEISKKTKYINNYYTQNIYLTFNYTRVLEEVYEIDSSDICHIHGEVGDELVIGHLNQERSVELSEEKNREEDSFFEGLDPFEEEYKMALEEFSYTKNHYNYKVEQLKYKLLIEYYDKTVKVPQNHIGYNKYFFNKISKVKNIYVVGHSLGDVDIPYFEEVFKRVDQNTRWNIFYYGENEKEIFEKKMLEIGIDKKKLIIKHSDLFYIK
ncbi:MAG: AbiH family protein [Clostridium sp.]